MDKGENTGEFIGEFKAVEDLIILIHHYCIRKMAFGAGSGGEINQSAGRRLSNIQGRWNLGKEYEF